MRVPTTIKMYLHFLKVLLILFPFFLPMQVSTSTGVKSHYFNLHVMVPTAFILGSDEYHTQAGNAISLVCIIENVSDFHLQNQVRTSN